MMNALCKLQGAPAGPVSIIQGRVVALYLQGEEAAHDFLLGLLVTHPSVTAALQGAASSSGEAGAAAAQVHADLATQLGHMVTASFMAPGT
jgi:hypothetical protein